MIRYEIAGGVVRVDVGTVLDAAQIFAFYADLGRDPAYVPGMVFLVDARRVTDVAPAGEMRETARGAVSAPIFAVSTRSAALVSNALVYGVVRQWAALSSESALETEPFYDEAEALRWLGVAPNAQSDVP